VLPGKYLIRNVPQIIEQEWQSLGRLASFLALCLVKNQIKKPFEQVHQGALEEFGRGERIRTSGLYVPNVALYQTKLHPDCVGCSPIQRPTEVGLFKGNVPFLLVAREGFEPPTFA